GVHATSALALDDHTALAEVPLAPLLAHLRAAFPHSPSLPPAPPAAEGGGGVDPTACTPWRARLTSVPDSSPLFAWLHKGAAQAPPRRRHAAAAAAAAGGGGGGVGVEDDPIQVLGSGSEGEGGPPHPSAAARLPNAAAAPSHPAPPPAPLPP